MDVECDSRSDTVNNTGNWNHFKINQKIPEQNTGESTNSKNYKKNQPHWALLLRTHAHTAGGTNVKVQNVGIMGNNITCSTDCPYRTTVTLYTVETWFVSGT